MKLTNKFNLPQPLLNALERQQANYAAGRGDARMSVTQLIGPPRIAVLRKLHEDSITEDISERTWALLGTAVHSLLELGKDEEHIAEERLSTVIDGWTISGGVDVQHRGNQCAIYDYKVSSSWKYKLQSFEDWEQQLNAYAYLVRINKGWEIEKLGVCLFVRDFMKGKVAIEEDYPPAPAVMIDIPLWSESRQLEFLTSRVQAHKEAIRQHAWEEELPECSGEDRWQREPDIALYKGDNKRATKVCKTKEEARDWLGTQKDPDIFTMVEREDKPTRCFDNYCGVSQWCGQWAKEKEKWEK